jgi:C4-dicarboxylate-specific signal transduction histidine kinase
MTAFIVGFFFWLYLAMNGAVIRCLAQTRTTELKGAEEKLVEYQELEAKVEERTKDLLEKEQSLETQNQELHKPSLTVSFTAPRMICLAKINAGFDSYCKESEEP